MKSLFWLIVGMVAFWAAVTYPVRLLAERQNWGHAGLTIIWSTTAALLCLLPTALTLIWTYRAQKGQRHPHDRRRLVVPSPGPVSATIWVLLVMRSITPKEAV